MFTLSKGNGDDIPQHRVKQEKRRHMIQKTEEPTEERGKGELRITALHWTQEGS